MCSSATTILALDAKFQNYIKSGDPVFQKMYIRRRNQLLMSKQHCGSLSRDEQYRVFRKAMLSSKFGVNVDNVSQMTCQSRTMSVKSLRVGPLDSSSSNFLRMGSSPARDSSHWDLCTEDSTKLTGSITRVAFAYSDPSRLAIATSTGGLFIYQVQPFPATPVVTLSGHKAEITDICWSENNDMMLTTSLDKTAKIWLIQKSLCIRSLESSPISLLYCGLLLPGNNNLAILGLHHKYVQTFNISTGKKVAAGMSRLSAPVKCLHADPAGYRIWAGDAAGWVFTFAVDCVSGRLTRLHRLCVGDSCPINSLSYRPSTSSLLASVCANSVFLLHVSSMVNGKCSLSSRSKLRVVNYRYKVRSIFSHVSTPVHGLACSGGEDGTAMLWDVSTSSAQIIQTLTLPQLSSINQQVVVSDVCFTDNENLLALGTSTGLVAFYKKREHGGASCSSVTNANETGSVILGPED